MSDTRTPEQIAKELAADLAEKLVFDLGVDAFPSEIHGPAQALFLQAIADAEARGRATAVETLRATRDRLYGRCEHMDALENENARFNWSQVEILNEMIEVLELPPPRPVE